MCEHTKCSIVERLEGDPKHTCRNWCVLAYPESFPDAIEWLKSRNIPFAACLHLNDVYKDGEHAGQLKKPHWHIVIKWSGNKSLNQMLILLDPRFVRLDYVDDIKFCVRYLIHADSPDKYQYNKSDIEANIDIEQYFNNNKRKYTAQNFVRDADEQEFRSFRAACKWALATENYHMLGFLQSNTYFVKQYLDVEEMAYESVRSDLQTFAESRINNEISNRLANLEKDFYGVEDVSAILKPQE